MPSLPPWGDDPLSSFLAAGAHSERSYALNYPTVDPRGPSR